VSTQQLFYEQPTAVSQTRHEAASVEVSRDFSFARQTNTVPLTAVEFPNAAAEYAIVFAGTDDALMPAVILGLRQQQNLYVNESGGWKGRYVPAFARRYPFVFSSGDDGQTFTLCIDEGYPGFNHEGRGERLFDDSGERTSYLERVLNFLKEYQLQFQRTRVFCDKLKELDLLEPVRADFTLESGERASLAGFMVINRTRLKALDGEKLAELARSDALELAYLQMHSLHNLQRMREMLGNCAATAESGASTVAAGPSSSEAEPAQNTVPAGPCRKRE
jgi:hypothetical protein